MRGLDVRTFVLYHGGVVDHPQADNGQAGSLKGKGCVMAEEATIHRATVRLEKPICDVLVRVALENHLHTPRRGPNITGAIRWLVLDLQQLRSEARGANRNSVEVA